MGEEVVTYRYLRECPRCNHQLFTYVETKRSKAFNLQAGYIIEHQQRIKVCKKCKATIKEITAIIPAPIQAEPSSKGSPSRFDT